MRTKRLLILGSVVVLFARLLAAQGIYVGQVKVYDDGSLQMMLSAARARLAALDAFSNIGIQGRVGGLSGANLTFSSVAAQVSGPPLPDVTNALKGATRSVTDASDNSKDSTTTTDQTTDVTTKRAVQNAPIPTAAGPAMTIPTTGMGPSASDILNEQLQLSLEVANLQLLLEGSVSDRIIEGTRYPKQRVTLGFPVSITPQENHKDAVAVVEVTVFNAAHVLAAGLPPAITMLLPREKSYNVAAITDRSTSIGGGIVTSVISGGVSALWGKRTFYVVQDQDTIATLKPAADGTVKFAWNFRPVLGRKVVREGLRQVFVQLAFPIVEGQGCQGSVLVRTYWQKYDRKANVLKSGPVIDDATLPVQAVRRFDLRPRIERVAWEDAGAGSVIVRAEGQFLPGTYVRIGDTILAPGVGITAEAKGIRFEAKAIELIRNPPVMVTRDGAEVPIVNRLDQAAMEPLDLGCAVALPQTSTVDPIPFTVRSAKVLTADDSNSRLQVDVDYVDALSALFRNDLVLQVGAQVFGLSDAPIERIHDLPTNVWRMTAKVPTSVIAPAREVRVVPLLWSPQRIARKLIEGIGPNGAVDKLVLLKQVNGELTFILYGTRLKDADILEPKLTHTAMSDFADDVDSVRIIKVQDTEIKQYKSLVLKKKGERPMLLSIPAIEVTSKRPEVKAKERVTVGSNEAILLADRADEIKSIKYVDTALAFVVSKDKKSVSLQGLAANLTASAMTRELTVEYPDSVKVAVLLEVVTSKIETVSKQ